MESIWKRVPKDDTEGVVLEANIMDLQSAIPLIEKEVQRQSDEHISKHTNRIMDKKGARKQNEVDQWLLEQNALR